MHISRVVLLQLRNENEQKKNDEEAEKIQKKQHYAMCIHFLYMHTQYTLHSRNLR